RHSKEHDQDQREAGEVEQERPFLRNVAQAPIQFFLTKQQGNWHADQSKLLPRLELDVGPSAAEELRVRGLVFLPLCKLVDIFECRLERVAIRQTLGSSMERVFGVVKNDP